MTDEFIPTVGSRNCNDSLLAEFIPFCGVSWLDEKTGIIFDENGNYLLADTKGECIELSKNGGEDKKANGHNDLSTDSIDTDAQSANISGKENADMVSQNDNISGKENANMVSQNDNISGKENADMASQNNNISSKANTDNDSKKGNTSSKDNTIKINNKEKGNNKKTDSIENKEKKIDETKTAQENSDSVPALTYPNGIKYEWKNLTNYDFLLNNIYNVASSTSVYPEELDGESLLNMDMTMDLSGEDYKILIYHTHGSEAFLDSREDEMSDTVVGLGDELTKILEEDYDISVYHDRTVYDMAGGTLDRSGAYDYAAEGIDAILAEYPSIEVIIDIHRDGVNDDVHLVKMVDGKPTAQIMLLNGMSRLNSTGDIDYLYNPYKEENLSFSLKLHLAGKEMYGDLMRRIFISGYCYNLNRKPRALLVEVGAQTNTVEEAKNAMEPLAKILYQVLSGEK